MTKKYSLSIPDASMFGIKLSGVNPKNNPFKISGEVLLKIDRHGFTQYTVVKTDFNKCFPVDENFYSPTTMFCNALNWNLNERKSHQNPWFNLEAKEIQHHTNFFIFSKHKVDLEHWNVIIYDPSEEKFNPHIDNMIDDGILKYEFSV